MFLNLGNTHFPRLRTPGTTSKIQNISRFLGSTKTLRIVLSKAAARPERPRFTRQRSALRTAENVAVGLHGRHRVEPVGMCFGGAASRFALGRDFAAEHGIEYVILDEGWAVNLQADMMQVIPEIDLQELVDYGKSKNVGIILWAGYWAFARDMENVVKHYSDMGVKGFKVDFLDRDDQEMVNFVYEASEVCAKYKMLVDFHGVFKPTGLQRTYPNVLNYEGVNGLEQLKWSPESYDMVTYDVTIPFIRMIAGPMDYTQGAMRNAVKGNYRPVNSEPMSQGTRCRQLATYVIFESPFNMLCDAPSNYRREKECTEFISNIPTIWDETVSLDGKVSEYVAIARRHGNDWYIGALTNWTPRELDLDLSFLGEGDYILELFKDGINADRAARDYKKEVISVPTDRKLKIHMAPGGGYAARIQKR